MTQRHGILLLLFVAIAAPLAAQVEDDVIVNEFAVNAAAGKEYIELLVLAPTANLQGWTLSDVSSRTNTTSTTEGDVTFPVSAAYLAAVPRGTYVVIELTTPTGNTSTLPEDLSLSDGTPRTLIIKTTTAGVVTGGTMDISTNENIHLYAGSRASGALIDQVLSGNNGSYLAGTTWGDNSAATVVDNINAGNTVPSRSAVRFVPLRQGAPDDFRDNDSGGVFIIDTLSYGTPGSANTGVDDRGLLNGADPLAPAGMTLSIAPQPLRGAGLARFTLPASTRATLVLTDIAGRVVRVLSDGDATPGSHTVVVDASLLAPGLYLARLTGGAGAVTARIAVVR
jgi:hypothetical protein